MERVNEYMFLLDDMFMGEKKANVKKHLLKKVKENDTTDSQLIMFLTCMELSDLNRNKQIESSTIDYIEEIKLAIARKDDRPSTITMFESVPPILHTNYTESNNHIDIYDGLFNEYKQLIGERVENWNKVYEDNLENDATIIIYSRASYHDYMKLLDKKIKKAGEGYCVMRLEQIKKAIVNNHKLNRFR